MKKIFLAFIALLLGLPVFTQVNVSNSLLKGGFTGRNTWAIIIANEDYQSFSQGYTGNEELAIYQAERFQQMLIKKAGVPRENIQFYADATNTHIKLAISKLQKNLNPNSKIIFYYRGKVFKNNPSDELFLIPVDSDSDETFYMFGLKDLQSRLGRLIVASVDIFIDAMPELSSGTLCMLDSGFVKLPTGQQIIKNLTTYQVHSPETTTNSVQIRVNTLASKPVLKVLTPAAALYQTLESSVLISGKVVSDCPIMVIAVNGEEASFSDDGSFKARVSLSEGENSISIEAKNCIGWSSDKIIVTRIPALSDSLKISQKEDSIQQTESSVITPKGKNYALLIGVSEYKDILIPDLFFPIKDASSIRELLISHYEFAPENVIMLINPSKSEITGALDSLSKVIKNEDSFLMFYAGHGTWNEKARMGYWLPSDAAAKGLNNWIMNSVITSAMSVIPAKHVLIIADACFGGSIFRTRAFMPAEEKSILDLYAKNSRKAMTSGDMTEVPDESIFLKYFLQKLEDNTEDYITSEKLFFEVKPMVESSVDLFPQFGIIKNTGDQGGDYIFFKKQ